MGESEKCGRRGVSPHREVSPVALTPAARRPVLPVAKARAVAVALPVGCGESKGQGEQLPCTCTEVCTPTRALLWRYQCQFATSLSVTIDPARSEKLMSTQPVVEDGAQNSLLHLPFPNPPYTPDTSSWATKHATSRLPRSLSAPRTLTAAVEVEQAQSQTQRRKGRRRRRLLAPTSGGR